MAVAATPSRMSLSRVESSRRLQPLRTLVYGPEKVGKTGFCCQAEGLVALDVESRMGHYDVPKFPTIETWKEALAALEELRTSKHSFKNVLIDSATSLEKMLKIQVCKDSGWTASQADEFTRWVKLAVNSYWPEFFIACERLERERDMGVLITAHMQVKQMKNPQGEPYDRYRPSLCGEQGPQLFLHWAHDVLFTTYEDNVFVMKSAVTGRDRARTSTTGQRVIYTQHTPAYDAGNSCGLPRQMPMNFMEYNSMRLLGLGSAAEIVSALQPMIATIESEEVRAKVAAYLTQNSQNEAEVRKVLSRVREILSEQEAAKEAAQAQ